VVHEHCVVGCHGADFGSRRHHQLRSAKSVFPTPNMAASSASLSLLVDALKSSSSLVSAMVNRSFASVGTRSTATANTRVESRRQMAVYLRGLLSETERKNGWTLAEAAGDGGPQGMLNFYAWDADGVRDDVRAVVAQALGDAERGVLIVDLCRHRDYAECGGEDAGQGD
jgi:hypothetical protein